MPQSSVITSDKTLLLSEVLKFLATEFDGCDTPPHSTNEFTCLAPVFFEKAELSGFKPNDERLEQV
jgi:hypothetical protein